MTPRGVASLARVIASLLPFNWETFVYHFCISTDNKLLLWMLVFNINVYNIFPLISLKILDFRKHSFLVKILKTVFVALNRFWNSCQLGSISQCCGGMYSTGSWVAIVFLKNHYLRVPRSCKVVISTPALKPNFQLTIVNSFLALYTSNIVLCMLYSNDPFIHLSPPLDRQQLKGRQNELFYI